MPLTRIVRVSLAAVLLAATSCADEYDSSKCPEEDVEPLMVDFQACEEDCAGDDDCVDGCWATFCSALEDLDCDVSEILECSD